MGGGMSLGENLQKLRDAIGISQAELAKRAGVSLDSLRNWEQDRVLPRVDTAAKLAQALGVSVDELLKSSPPPAADEPRKRGKK
jgi:transcriptional regulator with XRE-family HTH domain